MVTNNIDFYLSGLKQQFRSIVKPIFGVREQAAQKIQMLRDLTMNPLQDFDAVDSSSLYKEIEELINQLNQPIPKFKINIEYLNEIREKLVHFVQILLPQQTKVPNHLQIEHIMNGNANLAFFIPEQRQLSLFNILTQQISNVKLDTQLQLPDMCQTVIHKENVYLMAGMAAGKHNVYLPSASAYRIPNVITPFFSSMTPGKSLTPNPLATSAPSEQIVRQVERLQEMYIEKAKCAVVAVDDYIYQFGGMQSQNRLRASTCERYSIQSNSWEILPRMVRARLMCNACHVQNQQKIYVFGGISDKTKVEKMIEVLDLKDLSWTQIEVQNKISYIPRHSSFCIQQNSEEILIIGGMVNRKADRSQIVQIYNIRENYIIDLGQLLPQGVCQDGRCSDPVRFGHEVYLMNSVIGSVYPIIQQRLKECAVIKMDCASVQTKNILTF